MTDAHTTTTVTFKDRVLRGIAILGLIALLLLGAWGIIQIAFTLYGFLGNTSPFPTESTQTTTAPKTEALTASVPTNIPSGTPFTLSFTHENAQGNYAYQFSYACVDGLSVQAPVPTGSMQTVPCNTPFNYTNVHPLGGGTSAQVQLVAKVTGTAPASTVFTVAAKNLATNQITVSGNSSGTVIPSQTTKPVSSTSGSSNTSGSGSTVKPSSTYVQTTRSTRSYSGSPDLAVTMGNITNLGGGRYSVQFTISNVGSNVAASGWTFNTVLPTSPTYTYHSNTQQALKPGDKIVYTLGFTMAPPQPTYGYPPYGSYGYANTSYNYQPSCGYMQTYTYNGVYNYPNLTYTCNNTNVPYNYTYNNYPTYNSGSYQTYAGSNVVTVTIDSNYGLIESSLSNNTASAAVY